MNMVYLFVSFGLLYCFSIKFFSIKVLPLFYYSFDSIVMVSLKNSVTMIFMAAVWKCNWFCILSHFTKLSS